MSNQRSKFSGAFLIAILAVGLLGFTQLAEAATKVRTYTPFTESGELKAGLTVVEKYGANCWFGGINGREDAWRCMVGNLIHDPCFESPVESLAVCPGFPGSRRVTQLTDPTFERDYQNTRTRGSIWAVRVGRYHCVMSSGARSEVRGRYPTFFCNNRGLAVWGRLDKRRKNWRALIGTYQNPNGWRWRTVASAWR